jgi:hypothetical protein
VGAESGNSIIQTKKYKTAAGLLLLTAAALLVHGYHPYAEDAEIYLPGVERILNPGLFPAGREFFASHASLTLFPNLIAMSLRISHLPMEVGIFLWHVASIFLLLLACWELSGILFTDARARWAGVGLVAALLTIPVAGTALYIVDQYLNPRNLAAFCAVFAVARCLQKKYVRAVLWLVVAGSVHPLMASFAFSFCALLGVIEVFGSRFGFGWLGVSQGRTSGAKQFAAVTSAPKGDIHSCAVTASLKRCPDTNQHFSALKAGDIFGALGMFGFLLLPFGISLDPPTSRAYHEAAMRHHFHYVQLWQWYEWLGIVAPIALLWWFYRIAVRQERKALARLCRALVIYGTIYFVAALIVDFPARFESLARLQPLRSLHLLYMLLFLVMGGFAGEYVLKNRLWRWLALFVPLAAGMFFAQRELFPQSAHIEWPGVAAKNPWAQAFVWVREHTPVDAMFALDPRFMQLPGEDAVGFRCLAERSRLADQTKDSGAVSMFPPLAEEWWAQVQAQSPWESFQLGDFERLKDKYGVNWVVIQRPVPGIECAYDNGAVRVCQLL